MAGIGSFGIIVYYSSRIRGQTVPLNVYYTDVCEHSPVFADLISTLVKKSRFSSFHHDINLLSPSPNAPMSITRQPTGRFGRNLNPSLEYDPSSNRRPIGVAFPPPPRSFRPGRHSNERFREEPLPPKLLTPTPITRQPTGRFGRNLNLSLGYDPSSNLRPIGVVSPPPPRSFSASIQTNDFVEEKIDTALSGRP